MDKKANVSLIVLSHKGKKYCPTAKQIPENILLPIICEVLGQSEFEETAAKEKLERIVVPAPNELQFLFRDGTQVQRHWEHISRSESWTEEMKQQARERSLQWSEK